MRDILFRGKRADNGEWVEGFYMYYQVSPIKGQQFHTITNGKLNWCGLLDKTNILPETVGQYTGVTDENGKKIFEGDIVGITDIYDNTVIYSIDYKSGSFCINQKGVNFSTYLGSVYNGKFGIEVIGNIYDNPELVM